jgi:uncharacterized membrane protein YuzA (DUF378 family)
MKCLKVIVTILLIIGGLNWGLYGLMNYDVVEALFGVGTLTSKAIYDVIGLAAVIKIISWQRHSCQCNK